MKIWVKIGIVMLVWSGSFMSAFATEDRGKEIMQAADKRDIGFVSSDWTQELILTNALGKENRRLMRVINLEGDEALGDKTLLVFREPKDSKGISLLTHGIKNRDDNQWMYLPNLKRVKRIAPGAKTSRFVGSEFTFEDLAVREVDDFSYRFIKGTEFAGVATYEIELVPLDPKSGYSRQIAMVDQKELTTLKVDFYDKKNRLEKTVYFEDYQQYLDKHWRPHTTRMINHQNKKQSRLMVSGNYQFETGFTEKDFSKNKLKNIR